MYWNYFYNFRKLYYFYCSRNKQLIESIINDDILDELLNQAGISNDTSVRKDLTPEKAASELLNLATYYFFISFI